MSLADIKLDRQRKRNEAAEAALYAAPPQIEKRQLSRTKAKWKPFDLASDAGGGVPVETRVNTYSRTSSHSRPVSALSHRTDESGRSDASGFQLFTGGRRGRRHPTELRNYGSEKQQTTVEAEFDQREIYEVFGNALPGPEFLVSNTGSKNGQIQFLQHPNGDVSAQQWSASAFRWVNVGHFSNIRKKVEGQLQSDRLKGETAYHTLQQNTLQYFRTIAKQREAMVMGLPFGMKEIQAALPVPTTASTGTLESDRKTQAQTSLASHAATLATGPQDAFQTGGTNDIRTPTATQRGGQTTGTAHEHAAAQAAPRSPLPPNVPKEPLYMRDWKVSDEPGGVYADNELPEKYRAQIAASTRPGPNYNATSSYNANNPYYAGFSNYGYQHAAQTPYVQTPYRMPQGYQFPPVAVPNPAHQSPGAQKYFNDRMAIADKMQSQLRQVYGNQMPANKPYGQQPPPYYRAAMADARTPSSFESKSHETSNDREIIAPQPKSVVSSFDRTAMRQTLQKLGEAAKERNLSQNNIRTVLHDPFQSPSAEVPPSTKTVTAQNAESPPVAARGRNQMITQSSPLPPVRDHRRGALQQSSPDTQWTKRPYEHTTPMLTKSATSKLASQAMTGPTAGTRRASEEERSTEPQKTYEEYLNDWWMNGSTFARQEDLFQAIKAAQATDDKINSPPAHLTPIGPPSRNPPKESSSSSFNETTTRLLIPVWENLASYVDGPKQRDYWCSWGPAPEWCIDRSPEGNNSFFEADWGSPPQRVGRDPRYTRRSGSGRKTSTENNDVGAVGTWKGIDRRFAHAKGM